MGRKFGDHTITAAKLPEIRALMIQDNQEGEALGALPSMAATNAALAAADLYFITDDMFQTVQAASQQLRDYTFSPEELPSENGLLIWEGSIGTGHVGISWTRLGGNVKITCLMMKADIAATMVDPRTGAPVKNAKIPGPAPVGQDVSLLMGANMEVKADSAFRKNAVLADRTNFKSGGFSSDEMKQMLRLMMSLFLIMRQTIVVETEVYVPRGTARWIERMDPNLLGATRYCTLRHKSMNAERVGKHEGAGRVFRHQWVSRGHWRDQPYPSKGTIERIWIPMSIKGPDGAPLLDPSKLVNILKR